MASLKEDASSSSIFCETASLNWYSASSFSPSSWMRFVCLRCLTSSWMFSLSASAPCAAFCPTNFPPAMPCFAALPATSEKFFQPVAKLSLLR